MNISPSFCRDISCSELKSRFEGNKSPSYEERSPFDRAHVIGLFNKTVKLTLIFTFEMRQRTEVIPIQCNAFTAGDAKLTHPSSLFRTRHKQRAGHNQQRYVKFLCIDHLHSLDVKELIDSPSLPLESCCTGRLYLREPITEQVPIFSPCPFQSSSLSFIPPLPIYTTLTPLSSLLLCVRSVMTLKMICLPILRLKSLLAP